MYRKPDRTTLGFPEIERLHRIATLLRANIKFTARELAERAEVSRKTVVRDLAFLRDRLGYDFEWVSTENTYRLRSAPAPKL